MPTTGRPKTASPRVSHPHPALGTAALLLGAVLAALTFAAETTGLPFHMPRSWYANRPLWYALMAGSFVVGWWLLRHPRGPRDGWRPTRPGRRFESLVLYTRRDCPLCEDAHDTLLRYAAYLPELIEVDVDEDDALRQRFDTCVPVVEIDGKVRFRGRVNETLLRRMIEAVPPA